ncbi:MAG: hypothetical protein ACD_47C00719G0001 [uncultured bacterium]|nr:MAG: hypothetical protein ACD_47C00719G0001 [uncultured bacterium]
MVDLALEHGLQLADVSGPVIIFKAFGELGGDVDLAAFEVEYFSAAGGYEVFNYFVYIFEALPQRRNADLEYVEAVIQIFSEKGIVDLGLDVFIGGADYSDVDLLGRDAADPGDLSGRNGPQQLDLGIRRKVGDLI